MIEIIKQFIPIAADGLVIVGFGEFVPEAVADSDADDFPGFFFVFPVIEAGDFLFDVFQDFLGNLFDIGNVFFRQVFFRNQVIDGQLFFVFEAFALAASFLLGHVLGEIHEFLE